MSLSSEVGVSPHSEWQSVVSSYSSTDDDESECYFLLPSVKYVLVVFLGFEYRIDRFLLGCGKCLFLAIR